MNRLVTGSCAANSTAKCPDNAASQGYAYVFDRFGNRWQQNLTAGTGPAPQYTFDANNHISGAPGNCTYLNAWCYDAAGNLMNDSLHTYVYDAENRIIQVDGGNTAVYTYDAEGRRVRKVAGTTVDYVYDHGGRQIAELTTSGAWNRQEVYVGGRHLATYSGTTTYFHNSDWLGTERVRTDVNGNSYETCQSLPFGDGQACVGGDPSPMHFTGKQRDTESNLDGFPARYYASVQGRWLTADWSVTPEPVPYAKLADPQSLNLYAYVDNDPSNHADPDGHENFCPDCAESADSSSEAKNKGSGQAEDKPQMAVAAPVTTAPLAVDKIVVVVEEAAEKVGTGLINGAVGVAGFILASAQKRPPRTKTQSTPTVRRRIQRSLHQRPLQGARE